VLIAGAAIFYFFYSKKEKVADQPLAETKDTSTPAATKPDTATLQAAADTSIKPRTDTVSLKPVMPAPGNYSFIVAVIKEYRNKEVADRSVAKFTKYGYKMSPIDSVRYKMAIPFNRPLSDTTRVKDSLAIFFGSKTYIDQ
jgi:hypothetical protein